MNRNGDAAYPDLACLWDKNDIAIKLTNQLISKQHTSVYSKIIHVHMIEDRSCSMWIK